MNKQIKCKKSFRCKSPNLQHICFSSDSNQCVFLWLKINIRVYPWIQVVFSKKCSLLKMQSLCRESLRKQRPSLSQVTNKPLSPTKWDILNHWPPHPCYQKSDNAMRIFPSKPGNEGRDQKALNESGHFIKTNFPESQHGWTENAVCLFIP